MSRVPTGTAQVGGVGGGVPAPAVGYAQLPLCVGSHRCKLCPTTCTHQHALIDRLVKHVDELAHRPRLASLDLEFSVELANRRRLRVPAPGRSQGTRQQIYCPQLRRWTQETCIGIKLQLGRLLAK